MTDRSDPTVMSEDASAASRQPANRPGTSCLGCRRRKLKCSRETSGCQNCTKSDLPCVYPAPDPVGVKRKRGPYKKDKPPRQRHMEDLVKYLEPKSASPDSNGRADLSSLSHTLSPEYSTTNLQATSHSNATNGGAAQLASSEDLVKDALIALTKSSVSEQANRRDDGAFLAREHPASALNSVYGSHHPSLRRIFEYWQIFVTRVDPMTKVIHCPSFGKKLFGIVDNLTGIPTPTEALMFGIYYAAVSSCTAREAQKKFGEDQDTLLKRYGSAIEAAVSDNYDVPTLESLQALVLYIVCIRRHGDTNVRALFSLAVRSAQMIGMQQDPEKKFSFFEAQMRRRVWFHLYGLENKTAEEGSARGISIMANSNVQLPANLNDVDLSPEMQQVPKPRTGVTDMTFILLRFEIHKLVFNLFDIRKQWSSGHWRPVTGSQDVRDEQQQVFDQTKARLEAQFSFYLDASRPYDYMCLGFLEAMLIKARLTIDFPFGRTPTRSMPVEERMTLLGASVRIIKLTHQIAVDDRCPDWLWYFRGYVQWHALAIIVAELGWSTNEEFANTAWQVLDPILADWDTMYKVKREEPAWDHVNSMIQRARNLRQARQSARQDQNVRQAGNLERHRQACGSPINANYIMPIHDSSGRDQDTFDGPSHNGTVQLLHTSASEAQTTGNGVYDSMDTLQPFDVNGDGLAGLEHVDFDAFDEVFGTASWEFMDPFEDINGQLEVVQRCDQHLNQAGK